MPQTRWVLDDSTRCALVQMTSDILEILLDSWCELRELNSCLEINYEALLNFKSDLLKAILVEPEEIINFVTKVQLPLNLFSSFSSTHIEYLFNNKFRILDIDENMGSLENL